MATEGNNKYQQMQQNGQGKQNTLQDQQSQQNSSDSSQFQLGWDFDEGRDKANRSRNNMCSPEVDFVNPLTLSEYLAEFAGKGHAGSDLFAVMTIFFAKPICAGKTYHISYRRTTVPEATLHLDLRGLSCCSDNCNLRKISCIISGLDWDTESGSQPEDLASRYAEADVSSIDLSHVNAYDGTAFRVGALVEIVVNMKTGRGYISALNSIPRNKDGVEHLNFPFSENYPISGDQVHNSVLPYCGPVRAGGDEDLVDVAQIADTDLNEYVDLLNGSATGGMYEEGGDVYDDAYEGDLDQGGDTDV